jgi:hypothetical protein
VSPVYALVLIGLGTAAGRHRFFSRMGTRILGRFLPKSQAGILDKLVHPSCRNASAGAAGAAGSAAGSAGAAGAVAKYVVHATKATPKA